VLQSPPTSVNSQSPPFRSPSAHVFQRNSVSVLLFLTIHLSSCIISRILDIEFRFTQLDLCFLFNIEINAAGSTFGTNFRVTTFGESHGGGVGCIIDGCPPRIPLSEADMQFDLDRRLFLLFSQRITFVICFVPQGVLY
jgi:hypothetical protein